MILLDTHALLWMDADDPTLGRTARRAIDQAWKEQQIAVSAISFWECAMLHARGRITLPQSPLAWRGDLIAAGLVEWPIDGDIAVLAAELAMAHKDPADRFIVATAISHRASLLTADTRLLRWKHALKRLDARK
ncbi:MAG: type II toxin-antitoxin system VapC family toxin [Betaproteobacteria bacterium]|nr:MAG: type II toxin-antitoxin system VapC family toxin [Betaproteobacteria bacterium]